MPCMTYETPEEIAAREAYREAALTAPFEQRAAELEKDLAEKEAMLCAIMTAIESYPYMCAENRRVKDILFEKIDWAGSGIARHQLQSWWEKHQARDRERRRQERLSLQRKRTEALAKLTKEERDLLGLK